MALTKQTIPINFAQGLDTKTDPFQLSAGNFLALSNSVFTKGKRLTKRNGFGQLASLPFAASYLTTFNGDLTAIGMTFQTYAPGSNTWVTKGTIQPVDLDVKPLARSNTNQSQSDSAVSDNGFICTVYTDQDLNNLTNSICRYVIADVATGQYIVPPTALTPQGGQFVSGRVFLLGNNFVIVYSVRVVASYQLQFVAISTSNPTVATPPAAVVLDYQPSAQVSFDGVVADGNLYLAWNTDSSVGVQMTYLTTTLGQSNTVTIDLGHLASVISVTADESGAAPVIWVTYSGSISNNAYSVAVDDKLNVLLPATQVLSSIPVLNIASTASNGVMTFLYEVVNSYSYDPSVRTDYVSKKSVSQSGSVGSATVVLRSVGLASKVFEVNGVLYCLFAYGSPDQPTYFLADFSGNVLAKLAYQNGGGYVSGLPSVTVRDNQAYVSYLFKTLIQSVNKNTNLPPGTQTGSIYAQLGVNLAVFTYGGDRIVSAEIGNNLNITGGFLWAYDGAAPVEQEFFLYPDAVKVTTSTAGGNLSAQQYFYQVTYEWTDNQGNLFRSAPSTPVSVTTTGSTSSNTIYVPTLRLTYKITSPVKIVVYRWSVAQQSYYQVTSISMPVLNDPSVDSVSFVDTLSDTSILGNNLIYTTGGVIENIGPPATSNVTLFDDRLWLVDAENKNLLWFSKQVIQSTPVEMSDLLTFFVASSVGATGPTGPITALSAMDDKLIVFKQNVIYYVNGIGPDNTGANNQYSPATFINSMVGCSNQRSIVVQPQGLMFEFSSESGSQIWLLGRDLQTNYIGAPVEALMENATVLSSVAVPGTNQVRFNLSSGITLVYDYFYNQWGTFTVNATSSTIFQSLNTGIGPLGKVFQETPGKYLDGSVPVLMSFSTAWVNISGLVGYQRAYFFFLLGQYLTPFKLQCSVSYDYETAFEGFTTITPTNFTPTYGGAEANGQQTVYGQDSPYGGGGNILNWRVFLKKQRCKAFQVNIQEIYDSSFGVPAGEGFTLSGLSLVCAIKKSFGTISAENTVGTS